MRVFAKTLRSWRRRLWLCLLGVCACPCVAADFRSDFTIHYETGNLRGATFTGRLIYRSELGARIELEDLRVFEITRPDGVSSDLAADIVSLFIAQRAGVPRLRSSYFLFESLSEDRNGAPIFATFEVDRSTVRTEVFFGPVRVQSSSGRIDFQDPVELPTVVEPTSLTIQLDLESSEIIIEWTTEAGIEAAPTPSGPWSQIPDPVSPLRMPIAESRFRFFRAN